MFNILLKTSRLSIIILIFFISTNNCIAYEQLDISVIEIGAFEKNGYEWIKIYNNTNEDINLENWKFVEGFTESKPNGIKHSLKEYNENGLTLQAGSEGVICQNPENFLSEYENYANLIIDSSWGSLKESGERIQTLDLHGTIIEDFTYLPCTEYSLKRTDSTLADYTANNWSEDGNNNNNNNDNNNDNNEDESQNTAGGTSNETQTQEKECITINEILPNPSGADNENEFIELKNICDRSVNINGWTLNDNSNRFYTINNKDYRKTFVRSEDFFLIFRNISKIALNNKSGEKLKLFNPLDELIETIEYNNAVIEDESYAKNSKNEMVWTTPPTPGEKNIINKKNQNPIPIIECVTSADVNKKIMFDGSDSYDADGDNLFFIWDFGDDNSSTLINPTHSYNIPGKYKIKLSVFDDKNGSNHAFFSITINGEKLKSDKDIEIEYPKIFISEIFPNPEGKDDNEFIEIFNPNKEQVSLLGWSIKDSTDNKWIIDNDIKINEEEHIVFYKKDTGITLNNGEDEVQLLSPSNIIIDSISYQSAKTEMSYSLNLFGEDWNWTYEVTPGYENEYIYEKEYFIDDFKIKFNEERVYLKTDDIREEEEDGSLVDISGVVIVEPGILGSQIFYINGAQIYMHSKKFPEIRVGDYVNIVGEISESRGEKRIKVKKQDQITVMQNNAEYPEILETTIDEIDESFTGTLVKVSGEITEQKGNYLWIDDSTGEIKIYIKKYTNIKLEKLEENKEIEITGIITKNNEEFRLLPRSQNDINFKINENETSSDQAQKNIDNNKKINNKKNIDIKYIVVTLVGLSLIAGNIIYKNKK